MFGHRLVVRLEGQLRLLALLRAAARRLALDLALAQRMLSAGISCGRDNHGVRRAITAAVRPVAAGERRAGGSWTFCSR